MSKLLSMRDAIAELVSDGASVALGLQLEPCRRRVPYLLEELATPDQMLRPSDAMVAYRAWAAAAAHEDLRYHAPFVTRERGTSRATRTSVAPR